MNIIIKLYFTNKNLRRSNKLSTFSELKSNALIIKFDMFSN